MPSSIKDIPKLYKKISEWETVRNEGEDGLMAERSMTLMGEILYEGLKDKQPQLTPVKCQEICALSDFPKVLGIIMDLNDFFVNLREIRVKQTALMALSGNAEKSTATTTQQS